MCTAHHQTCLSLENSVDLLSIHSSTEILTLGEHCFTAVTYAGKLILESALSILAPLTCI